MSKPLSPNEVERRKKLFGVRVSDAIRAKITALRDRQYGTMTEVIAIAIDRLWLSHYGESTPKQVEAAERAANPSSG